MPCPVGLMAHLCSQQNLNQQEVFSVEDASGLLGEGRGRGYIAGTAVSIQRVT